MYGCASFQFISYLAYSFCMLLVSLLLRTKEKDAVVIDEKLETLDGTDTVLITNHSQPPLRTDSVRIPTAVKSPARPNMGDSDIESDHSDPGPIKNSALEKSSSGPQESATKVGDA